MANSSYQNQGENEARPTEKGSGPAMPTVDPTGFGGTTSISHVPPKRPSTRTPNFMTMMDSK